MAQMVAVAMDVGIVIGQAAKECAKVFDVEAVERLNAAMERAFRVARRGAILEMKIAEGYVPKTRAPRREGPLKKRVRSLMQGQIDEQAAEDREALLSDLYERLEDDGFEAGIEGQPIGLVIEALCKDLGFAANMRGFSDAEVGGVEKIAPYTREQMSERYKDYDFGDGGDVHGVLRKPPREPPDG